VRRTEERMFRSLNGVEARGALGRFVPERFAVRATNYCFVR